MTTTRAPLVRRLMRAVPVAGLVVTTGVVGITAHASPSAASDAFTGSVTATRTVLDATGKSTTIDTRHVGLHVSQTQNLRGRQEINVSWSGAHPTGGTVADINSGDAANEEYPMVLLECRGNTAKISPETCWTQTWSERFQSDNSTGWPAWRSDRYAPTAQRSASVDAPATRPAACFRAALAERWVPFDAVGGKTYYGGSVGCAGMAPESANVGGTGIPSNATYGVTGKDGRGSAQFDVWTSDENASLGCTDKVACSLVAVPIEGISCDAYGTQLPKADRPSSRYLAAAESACTQTGSYQPGESYNAGQPSDAAVTGALWWAASNWRNRITVPLNFAVPASECSVVSNQTPVSIYGSALMGELSASWEPKFCTDGSLHPFVDVQTSDSAARTLLSAGTIDAAFTSRTPGAAGFGRPVTQAPVAVTGFAISYAIDDAHGNRYGKLHLDARLLAKLLTESYPGDALVSANYPALAGNPSNITEDPEFQALNPGLPKYATLEAASTLSMLSSDADLTYALTSYINADPEARAWLDGTPDPWGMVVNPNYAKIKLPVESWPLLDDFQLPASYIASQNNPCYSYSPAPYLQLIANPSATLAPIVQDIQFAVSNADISCPSGVVGDPTTLKLTTQGRQQPGNRFVIGVTSLSQAHRYDLATAALQTSLAHPSLTRQFSDSAGRSFVKPDVAGLRKAAALLHGDKAQRTWTLDQAAVAATPGAYPGTMPVYADVPTTGLPAASATAMAAFLTYASGDGQHAGDANGDLPPGYLPLTAANGLGKLAAYTTRSGAAVAHQNGTVPSLIAPAKTDSSSTNTPPSSSSSSSTTGSGSGGPGNGGGGGVTGGTGGGGVAPTYPVTGPTASGSDTTQASVSAAPDASPVAGTVGVRSVAAFSRLGSVVLPIVLLLGLVCGLGGVLMRYPLFGAVAGRAGTRFTALLKGRRG